MRNKKLERWNWKSFLAGVVCSVAVFALGGSAVAATVGAMSQNQVNIIANGTTISKAGQNYVLSTGTSVPGSITYTDKNGGGTVYLPIRRLADILGTDISWDGSKNAVVVGQSSSTQPTEPIYYSKYPSILSIENIGGDLTYYTQNEVNYPQFGIYSYYYSYKTSTFENAKKYAKEYSDYLEKNGYSKTYDGVYETMPTILGEPSHEYKLLTPDKSKLVSIRYEYKTGQGGNTYYITINIENGNSGSGSGTQNGNNNVTYYSKYPGVPDFGAFAGIPAAPIGDLIGSPGYYYNIIDVDNAIDRNDDLLLDYENLLFQCGFSYIGNFDGDYGVVQCYSNGTYSIGVGIATAQYFSIMVLD